MVPVVYLCTWIAIAVFLSVLVWKLTNTVSPGMPVLLHASIAISMQATETALLFACPLVPAQCFIRSTVKHVKSAGELRYVQANRVQARFLLTSSEWSDILGVLTNCKCHEDSNVCVWTDHVFSCDSVCQSNFTAVLLACNYPRTIFSLCHLYASSWCSSSTYRIFVSGKQLLLLMRPIQGPVSSIVYRYSHSTLCWFDWKWVHFLHAVKSFYFL